MGTKAIIVYIEGEGGGGTSSKRRFLDGEFRKAWKRFLDPLVEHAKGKGIASFRCVPGRGGVRTADQFASPLPGDQASLRILLVDSEGPVSDIGKPWRAIKRKKPRWADDGHCYLMVQCLETWLLADVDRLEEFYNTHKGCFRRTKLKRWPDLERIDRKVLQKALVHATANCKAPYCHADGNRLIAIVSRDKLRSLRSVNRLFTGLQRKISEYADT